MRDFIITLLTLMHDHAIDYAIGGSIASSYYGEARTTQVIDLSILLDADGAEPFAAALESLGWSVSRDSMRHAVVGGGTFSATDGFWKVDFFVVQHDAFALEAFRRRALRTYLLTGQQAWFLSPEDVILHKLRWCAGRPLDKHVRDILAILSAWYGALDLAYVSRWVAAFGVGALWAGILDAFRRETGD